MKVLSYATVYCIAFMATYSGCSVIIIQLILVDDIDLQLKGEARKQSKARSKLLCVSSHLPLIPTLYLQRSVNLNLFI